MHDATAFWKPCWELNWAAHQAEAGLIGLFTPLELDLYEGGRDAHKAAQEAYSRDIARHYMLADYEEPLPIFTLPELQRHAWTIKALLEPIEKWRASGLQKLQAVVPGLSLDADTYSPAPLIRELRRLARKLVPELDLPSGESLSTGIEICNTLADVEAPAPATIPAEPQAGGHGKAEPVRPKRSTEPGEARKKIISALTKHHNYADGSCLNTEPIGLNELARQAAVSPGSVNLFMNTQFHGHDQYKALCVRDRVELGAALKLLNGEVFPHNLYGRDPDHRDTDGDE